MNKIKKANNLITGNKFLENILNTKTIKDAKVIILVGHGYTISNNNKIESLDQNNNLVILPTNKSIELPDSYSRTLDLINKEFVNLLNESDKNLSTLNLAKKIVTKANQFLEKKYNWDINSNKKYFNENGLLQKYTIFEESPNIFISLKGDSYLYKEKIINGKIKKYLPERNYLCLLKKNVRPVFHLPMEKDIVSFTLNDFIKKLKLENKIIIPIICTKIKQKNRKLSNNNWDSPGYTKKSLSRVFIKNKKLFNSNTLPYFTLNSKKKHNKMNNKVNKSKFNLERFSSEIA